MKTEELFQLAEWDLKFTHPALCSTVVAFEGRFLEEDEEKLMTTFIALSRAWQWRKIYTYSFDLFEDVLLAEFSYLKNTTEEKRFLKVPISKFNWTVIENDQEKNLMVMEYLIRGISCELIRHLSNLSSYFPNFMSNPPIMNLLRKLANSPPSILVYYYIGNFVGLKIETFRDVIVVKNP